MSEQENEGLAGESPRRHFTTRWGFVATVGFAVISLYFVWAAYDAAPTSFRFLSEAQAVGASKAVHGGHGGAAGGMTPADFRLRTEAFVEKFSLPDGSVKPRRHMESKSGRNAMPGDVGHGDDDQTALAPARHGDEAMADEHQMGRVHTPIGLLELTAAYRAYTVGEISAQAFTELQQQAIAGVAERSMGTTGDPHQAAESEPVVVPPAHDEAEAEHGAAEAGHAAAEAAHDEAEAEHGAAEAGHDAAEPPHAAAEAGHDEAEAEHAAAEAGHDEAEAEHGSASPGQDDTGPIDIYMMAMRYAYEPEVLRLEADLPYRFRIMSMDAIHGASVNVGFAGHIMRRPARTMAEMTMTFTEPGEYLVYCTVYCGLGHDMMKGKIIVE